MTQKELVDEIGALAQRAEIFEHTTAAIILYCLKGALLSGAARELATLCQTFAKAKVKRFEAARN